MKTHIIAVLAASAMFATPLAAPAQGIPSYASGGSYGDDSQIRGRIVNFDGAYNVQVRDDKGYVDNVQLHQGTIINPTGLTLAPGMVVSIIGYNEGSDFAANEIDTPYTYYNDQPYYEGHAWDYYGPSIGLSFFFGNAGWWHGSDFSGQYAYERGVRVYNNVNVRNIYHGGTFRGRSYIASPSVGGYVRGGYAHAGNGGGTNQQRGVYVHSGNTTTTINRSYTNHYAQPNNVARPAYAPQNNVARPAYAPQNNVARPAYASQGGNAARQVSAPNPGAGAAHAGGGSGAPHGNGGGGAPHGGAGAPHGGGGGGAHPGGDDHHH